MCKKQWYFLSFRNPDTNTNLGCCNIQSDNGPGGAVQKAWDLGINPGGEVRVHKVDDLEPKFEPNKLYSENEMADMGNYTYELGTPIRGKPNKYLSDISIPRKRW